MTATPPAETILLVENDPSIRRLIRRTLEGAGRPTTQATWIDRATTVVRLIALTKDARDGLGMAEMTIDRFPFKVGRECRTTLKKAVTSVERRLGIAPQLNDVYLVEPVLQIDHVVSREHFVIDVTQGKCILTDLGSVCGTTVNGKTIGGDRRGGQTELHDQDEITLKAVGCPFVFKFRVEF